MTWIRNPQIAAALLLVAAVAGLVVANTGLGPGLQALKLWHLPPIAGVDLSLAHWVTDGLLAVFFFVAAIELRYELTQGELADRRRAVVPAVAALGGVVVPAVLFIALVPPELERAWAIPTATDIAFALGVLAICGRRLPTAVRALLLALAIIDDLVAILIIAVLFTTDLQPLALVGAGVAVGVFWFLGRMYRTRRGSWPLRIAIGVVGFVVWWLVLQSGIHATIAGVLCGLVLSPAPAESARHQLEPTVNAFVLPLFAFVAASVAIPNVPIGELSPVFLAIAVALPIGKLIGISLAAAGAQAVMRMPRSERLGVADLVTVALLGGIGFTVALLMNELAHRSDEELLVAGTLGVLLGSLVAAVIGGALAAVRSSRIRTFDAAARAAEDAEAERRRFDGE